MNFTLKIAETEEEKRQAYEVRYECLTLEKRDERYANHDLRQYCDDHDTDGALIIIAVDDLTGKVVGTVRYIPRNGRPLPYDWCYDYEYLVKATGMDVDEIQRQSGLLDRGSVLKDFRGAIYWELLNYGYQLAKEQGLSVIVGTWVNSNYQLGMAHVRKHNWVIPDKDYYNSKGERYYFGYKLLSG